MKYFFKKRPWVSMRPEKEAPLGNYAERVETHRAAFVKALEDFPELRYLLREATGETVAELNDWLYEHRDTLSPDTAIVEGTDPETATGLSDKNARLVICTVDLSHIRHLNTMLNRINETLCDNGILLCHSRTSGYQRSLILKKYPGLWGRFLCSLHFLWHRAMARLKTTRWLYMWVTKGKNRSFPRVEILGRMYRAGFSVLYERFFDGKFVLVVQKSKAPIWDDDPTNGLLAKLPRVGYNGNKIGVYKVRTMYPYSEYLQQYMYEVHGLAEGGKFENDFRVNQIGRRIRGTWIDELPMTINLLKGQIKLVGVRPLSRQYLSLYTPEMQQLHVSVKPGLLPPFYYEKQTPQTIEEVQASEQKYIEAWHKHPFATDWHYFWGIMGNILFKHKRSK